MNIVPPLGRISCDYIGNVTILSWFYDPSSEDSYEAGHSLSFSVWSESLLSAWRTLGPYLPIAKFRGVSSRNVAEFLREIYRSFSAKFRRENPRQNKEFLFFSAKIFISRKGWSAAKCKKELFSWADLNVSSIHIHRSSDGRHYPITTYRTVLKTAWTHQKKCGTFISLSTFDKW